MGTPLRSPSIFDVTGTAAEVEAAKIQNGLQPQAGSEGLLGFDSTNRDARRAQLRRRRAVVCQPNGQVRPDRKVLRAPSVFTCPGGDSACQQELFLDEGFILERDNPTLLNSRRGLDPTS